MRPSGRPGFSLASLLFALVFGLLLLPGCGGGDDDDSPAGDDDTVVGDDDTQVGDDDTQAGDDDTQAGDDDTQAGDDDTEVGDDDTEAGDDDTVGTDTDGDGIADSEDNCPDVANDGQEDTDSDEKGDACDACPDYANPGSAACLTTIYDIKNETIPEETAVTIASAIVTATNYYGYFLQVEESDSAYAGADYSGIYVYSPGHELAMGNRVGVTAATVTYYYDEIELTNATVEVLSESETLPAATVVAPADVATDGSKAAALEGVLVEVQNVTVTEVEPEPGTGDSAPTNEFVVDSSLRVNDGIYEISPFPVVDDQFERITGILNYRYENSKLEPRSADDVVIVEKPAMLASIAPTDAVVPVSEAFTFTVALDRVASEGGAEISLALDPTDAGTVPATVTIPEGDYQVSFDFTASATPSTTTLSATYGDVTVDTTVYTVEVTPHLVVNEIDYDQDGSDSAEYVEIYNATDAAVDLSDIAVVMVNGNNSTEYDRYVLADHVASLEAGAYLVIADATVTVAEGVTVIPKNAGIQNGSPDGVAIITISDGLIVDALSYEGEITSAAIDGATDPQSLVEGNPFTTSDPGSGDYSLCRNPNGRDTDDAASDWVLSTTLTPGAANVYTTGSAD